MPRLPFALLVALVATATAASPTRADFLIGSYTAAGTMTSEGLSSFATLDPGRVTAGSDDRSRIMSVGGLKFALGAALAPGAAITSANLSFSVFSAVASGGSSSSPLLAISGSGSASTTLTLADFATAVGSRNVGSQSVPTITAGSDPPLALSFDVTALVQSLYGAGSAAVFFQFDNLMRQTSASLDLSPAPRMAPTLTIQFTPAATAVPEPASAVMAALGLSLAGALYAANRRLARGGASSGRLALN